MKYKRGVSAVITGIVAVVTLIGASPEVFAAGTATEYLTPASSSPKKGSTLTLTIYEDSGTDTTNAVQANLSYSTAQLHYVSFTNSPAFTVEAEDPTGDTGSLHFARGVLNGNGNKVSGAQSVVTVSFTVLASSGAIHVNFASGSAVIRSTDNTPESLTTTGGVYTVPATTTTTPKPTAKSPTPKPTATLTSPVTYATAPNPAMTAKKPSSGGLTISNLMATNDNATKNTIITWDTNRPATSIVAYGTDAQHLVVQTDGKLVTSHQVALNASMMQAGGNYYYYVSSTDSSGNKVSSQLLPFVAAGGTTGETKTNASSAVKYTILGLLGILVLAIVFIIIRKIGKSYESQRELARHFPEMPETHIQTNGNTVHPQLPPEPRGPVGPTVVAPSKPPEDPNHSSELKKY